MVAVPHQKRRVPPRVWEAARLLYKSDPTVTLPVIAERFGVTLCALKKHSSREKWREGGLDAVSGHPSSKMPVAGAETVPAITTRAEYRKAIQQEAVEWLCLLRSVRVVSGNNALGAIRQAAPLLGRLARMEMAFDAERDQNTVGADWGQRASLPFSEVAKPLDGKNWVPDPEPAQRVETPDIIIE